MLLDKPFPYISVIIPMRNEEEYVEKCIRSLINQDYPDNLYEILVVDGISNDNSKRITQSLAKKRSNILLFENADYLTSYGLNIGIRKSRGEIIIILGAHSFVENDFIRKNVELLKKMDGIDCLGGPIDTLGETQSAKAISLAMSSPFGVGDALFRYTEKEGYVDTVAFGAYKREIFEKIGLFDEALVRNQDDEFNYRLRKAGGRIYITPQIRSFYYSRATLRNLWNQYFQYGFWKTRVFQKHPKMMKIRQFIPGTFVLSIAISMILSFYDKLSFSLFLIILVSYATCNLFFSFVIAKKEGWKYLPLLPIVFVTMHFSYGIGFLTGLIRFFPKWFQKEIAPPGFKDSKCETCNPSN